MLPSTTHLEFTAPRLFACSLALDACASFTDAGLVAVALQCRGLRALSITHCTQLTDASLEHLVRLPVLNVLTAKHCHKYLHRWLSSMYMIACSPRHLLVVEMHVQVFPGRLGQAAE